MQPAIHIKRVIDFNKGFRSLLEVLKLIAVAEYHNLEKKLKSFDRLQELTTEFFDSVDLSELRHPFVVPSGKPIGVLAVTSDAGLLGGLNVLVVTKAVELVREFGGVLAVIGEKGHAYAQGTGLSYTHFPGIVDARRYAQAAEIRDFFTQKITTGELGGLKVVYPRAYSFVVHRIETATLMPFLENFPKEKMNPAALDPRNRMIFESTPDQVAEYLVYLIAAQRLYEIFGLARVCEQAARFVHLEESCNKIAEMNKKLLLQYFRRRHEIIDANMRELFSARSLYAK